MVSCLKEPFQLTTANNIQRSLREDQSFKSTFRKAVGLEETDTHVSSNMQ